MIWRSETRPHEPASVYYGHPLILWQDAMAVCVCVCVCVYGDVVILQPDSYLIYGIDLEGEGQVERGQGGCEQKRTISGCACVCVCVCVA